MAGTELQVLRRRVVRGLGLFKAGTATNGAVGSLIDTGLLSIYDDDYFKGSGIVIVSAGGAAPEGEKRVIQSGDQASSKVNVTIDFSAAPESGDTYEIYRGLQVEDVEDAVNEAIRLAAAGFWEPIVDVSLVWVAGQYVYDLEPLATDIDPLYGIDKVFVQSVSAPSTFAFDDVSDEVLFFYDENNKPCIQFMRAFRAGMKIRIHYRVAPVVMDDATDTTGVSYPHLDVYLRAAAVEQLMAAGFFGPQSKDIEWRQERWGMQRAEVIFERYRMPEPTGRVQRVAHHIPVVKPTRPDVALGG